MNDPLSELIARAAYLYVIANERANKAEAALKDLQSQFDALKKEVDGIQQATDPLRGQADRRSGNSDPAE